MASCTGKLAEATDGVERGSDAAAIDDLLRYFKFSYKAATGYRGLGHFKLGGSDGASEVEFCVACDPEEGVQYHYGAPRDGESASFTVVMTVDDFLRVYSGDVSGSELMRMGLSGRIWVNGFAIRAVQAFATSFCYESSTWEAFYADCSRLRDAGAEAPEDDDGCSVTTTVSVVDDVGARTAAVADKAWAVAMSAAPGGAALMPACSVELPTHAHRSLCALLLLPHLRSTRGEGWRQACAGARQWSAVVAAQCGASSDRLEQCDANSLLALRDMPETELLAPFLSHWATCPPARPPALPTCKDGAQRDSLAGSPPPARGPLHRAARSLMGRLSKRGGVLDMDTVDRSVHFGPLHQPPFA